MPVSRSSAVTARAAMAAPNGSSAGSMPRRTALSPVTSSAAISAMDRPATRDFRAAAVSRAPRHSGQVPSRTKPRTMSLVFSESAETSRFTYRRSKFSTSPSYVLL